MLIPRFDDEENMADTTLESVKSYYGKVLRSNQDLQTSACCTAEALPRHLAAVAAEIHDEVLEKFYGCGSPLPPALAGATVLDLGCGSGRDTFILSKLVGPTGRVIGIDMTAEQLAVAERHREWHARKFGHANVRLVHGYIEDLESAGIASASVDLVVSNCVINLSPDKRRVFAEVFRVLKPGGELCFSDVFAGRRVPAELARDPQLLGECLGGALYFEDFRRLMRAVGCLDARVVARRRIELTHPEIERRAGMIDFHSMTVRAFKLDLEDQCESYGQVARYLGTLEEAPHRFVLDEHHAFPTGQPRPVCGNTAAMLAETRYRPHFRVDGDRSVHYGRFECAPAADRSAPGECCT
jgi:SAM-dependent methyltransferase